MVQKYSQDHYNAGIIVKNGIGKIRNVSLQNYSTFEPPITHYGTFDLVSINGVNIGRPVSINRKETSGTSYSSFEHGSRINYMTIVMAGSKGNVLGGRVVGKLMALSNVLLFASTIKDYEFHEIMPDLPDYHVKHPYTSGVGQSTVEGLGSSSSSSSDSSSRASESTDEDPTWGSIPKSSKRIRLSDK